MAVQQLRHGTEGMGPTDILTNNCRTRFCVFIFQARAPSFISNALRAAHRNSGVSSTIIKMLQDKSQLNKLSGYGWECRGFKKSHIH